MSESQTSTSSRFMVVLPDDVGFSREWCSAALIALPERRRPVLLLRANHLGFRAENRETERLTLARGDDSEATQVSA
jgi:hypothetical protein